ncbi:hypothetical protein [Bradyrhizobium sp. cf659]|uniref:hypothetical protein n=1 Tax=Bradyrhizobium sp. cf659 TaxID=1761771 RepID=UPI0008ECE768|nr:hypothetical protein [Bradyrhizobium sp. cf659]SFK01649.1 hypothetical protein SAMN04487925_11532 [Bradyrhizobium sp. cf659]
MKSLSRSLTLALLFGSASMPANAGPLDFVTKPLTAPFEAAKKVIQGRPPGEIIQDQIDRHVDPAREALNQVQRAHDFINNAQRDLISRNLGPGWREGFDTLTAAQRIQQEIGFTTGRYLADCAQKGQCGLDQLAAVPVAAAMRDAYKVYAPRSQPLSPQLINYLRGVVPINVLASARWTVGNVPNLTVPGFLNAANEAGGNGFAVTLGNVMIFSRMPDPNTDMTWLLHEMFHIEQYMRFSDNPLESIDGFAVAYIQHYNAMENEAETNAEQREALLPQYYSMR